MPTIELTEEERAVLINVFAQHWAKAEISRLTAETTLPRSPMLDTLFEKITGHAAPGTPPALIAVLGGDAAAMEVSTTAFVLKVAHGLPTTW